MTSPRPRVTLASGTTEGVWRGATAAFWGIPFAEPPVGRRRWLAPVRRGPWRGIHDAGSPGATPQRRPVMTDGFVPEPSIPGDDTLLVNVFTPTPGPTADPHPVLVWFHGGGYLGGSPSSPWYDGRAFAERGIVVVDVSYRLGFVGFGWVEGADQNRGVLDWIAALEWVRDNISSFGGDPARVTIAGQSAGGGAVTTLLGMPEAQPLFRAAIAQSPAQGLLSTARARRASERMRGRLGIPMTVDALSGVDEALIVDAEREVARFGDSTPAETIADALEPGLDGELDVAFGPVVDGVLLSAEPRTTGDDKPLLIGTTAHEFMMVAWSARDELTDTDPIDLMRTHGIDEAAALDYVQASGIGDATTLVGQLVTDRMFRSPADALSRIPRSAGCWIYDFRWPNPFLGVSLHCMDLPFTWGLLEAEGVEKLLGLTPPVELEQRMHDAWTRFIVDGDPGWERVDPDRPRGMVFDAESRVVDDPYAASRLVRTVDRRADAVLPAAGGVR